MCSHFLLDLRESRDQMQSRLGGSCPSHGDANETLHQSVFLCVCQSVFTSFYVIVVAALGRLGVHMFLIPANFADSSYSLRLEAPRNANICGT